MVILVFSTVDSIFECLLRKREKKRQQQQQQQKPMPVLSGLVRLFATIDAPQSQSRSPCCSPAAVCLRPLHLHECMFLTLVLSRLCSSVVEPCERRPFDSDFAWIVYTFHTNRNYHYQEMRSIAVSIRFPRPADQNTTHGLLCHRLPWKGEGANRSWPLARRNKRTSLYWNQPLAFFVLKSRLARRPSSHAPTVIYCKSGPKKNEE